MKRKRWWVEDSEKCHKFRRQASAPYFWPNQHFNALSIKSQSKGTLCQMPSKLRSTWSAAPLSVIKHSKPLRLNSGTTMSALAAADRIVANFDIPSKDVQRCAQEFILELSMSTIKAGWIRLNVFDSETGLQQRMDTVCQIPTYITRVARGTEKVWSPGPNDNHKSNVRDSRVLVSTLIWGERIFESALSNSMAIQPSRHSRPS